MAKEDEKTTEVKPKPDEVALLTTVKEYGMGLQVPDGTVFDLSDVSQGQALWIEWVSKKVVNLEKSLG